MINSHEDYEAALEKAVALMAQPPEAGGPDHADFLKMLHEIQDYHDRVEAVADHGPFAKERADLTRRLAAYAERYKNQEKLAHDHHEGEGVGPTPFI